jgi:polyisoprenoid-binding protein YceI
MTTTAIPVRRALGPLLCGFVLAAGANAARADWAIDNAQSNLSFVSTKAPQAGVGGVQEVQTFRKLAGKVDGQGQISFSVDLASVDTSIGIRDERLRTMLFNVASMPTASFTAKLEPGWAHGLDAAARDIELNGQFTLAGQTKPMAAKLRVVRVAPGRIVVSTRAPVVVNAADHGLRAGVEALREVMGLGFLASSAPVSFSLVLNEQR